MLLCIGLLHVLKSVSSEREYVPVVLPHCMGYQISGVCINDMPSTVVKRGSALSEYPLYTGMSLRHVRVDTCWSVLHEGPSFPPLHTPSKAAPFCGNLLATRNKAICFVGLGVSVRFTSSMNETKQTMWLLSSLTDTSPLECSLQDSKLNHALETSHWINISSRVSLRAQLGKL